MDEETLVQSQIDEGNTSGRNDAGSLSPIGVPPSKLAHVVFRTARFQELVHWYKVVLCATSAFENESLAFLRYDNEHHRIAIVNAPVGSAPKGVSGVHHVAFTWPTLRSLLETYKRLLNLGIRPIVAVNHGPTTSIFYADPDGNQLEFQIDNYDTLEELDNYFQTPMFRINPVGVDFDPEVLWKRLEAGEPENTLKERPDIGPRSLESYPVQ